MAADRSPSGQNIERIADAIEELASRLVCAECLRSRRSDPSPGVTIIRGTLVCVDHIGMADR